VDFQAWRRRRWLDPPGENPHPGVKKHSFPIHTAGFYNRDVARKAKPTTRIPRAFWIVAALCFVALLFSILFSVYYFGGRVGFQ
jgi:hypothetical protein